MCSRTGGTFTSRIWAWLGSAPRARTTARVERGGPCSARTGIRGWRRARRRSLVDEQEEVAARNNTISRSAASALTHRHLRGQGRSCVVAAPVGLRGAVVALCAKTSNPDGSVILLIVCLLRSRGNMCTIDFCAQPSSPYVRGMEDGREVILDSHYTRTILVRYWYYLGTALVVHKYCTGTTLVLHRCDNCTGLVLHRCCATLGFRPSLAGPGRVRPRFGQHRTRPAPNRANPSPISTDIGRIWAEFRQSLAGIRKRFRPSVSRFRRSWARLRPKLDHPKRRGDM